MLSRSQIIAHLDANEYLSQEDKRQILDWLKGREVPEEEWRDVPGYEGVYQVSNFGQVRSLERWVNNNGGKRLIRESILKPKDQSNYKYVALCKKGSAKNNYIHRLVATVFIPNPLNKPEVNHLLGIKSFNWSINLEWATRKENEKHAIKNGLRNNIGENHPMAQVSKKDVLYIREMKGVVSRGDLSDEFGISKQTVSDIQNRRRWKHL